MLRNSATRTSSPLATATMALPNFLSVQSSTRLRRAALSSFALCAMAMTLNQAAHAEVYRQGSAVTAMPGGGVVAHGLRVAVISATTTEGEEIDAQRALVAAHTA